MKLLRSFEAADYEAGASRLLKVVDKIPEAEWDEEYPELRKWVKRGVLTEEIYFDPNLAPFHDVQEAARIVGAKSALRRTGVLDLTAYAPASSAEVFGIGAYIRLLADKFTPLVLTPYTYPYYVVAEAGLRKSALHVFGTIKEMEESGKREDVFLKICPASCHITAARAFHLAKVIGVWEEKEGA